MLAIDKMGLALGPLHVTICYHHSSFMQGNRCRKYLHITRSLVHFLPNLLIIFYFILMRLIKYFILQWIDKEVLKLQKLIDRANEKGWRREYP